jgi:hypothetical protein
MTDKLILNARLVQVLPIQSGTSSKGVWTKQDFIVETFEQYPKKVCINVWGDAKIAQLASIHIGATVNAYLNLSSREYNSRWYTEIQAWKLEVVEQGTAAPQPAQAAPVAPVSQVQDDLPF